MAANSQSPALLRRPVPYREPAPSAPDDPHCVAHPSALRSRFRGRSFDTVSRPGCGPPRKDRCAVTLWWNQTGPDLLSNQESNHGQRLPRPQPIPTTDKRIGILDRGNVHKGSERLPYLRSLPVRAAVRLLPVLPIKALDPVGTSFLLLITTNRVKVTEIISGPAE